MSTALADGEVMQAARGLRRVQAKPLERFSMRTHEKVIFEHSHPGRGATDQWPQEPPRGAADIPAKPAAHAAAAAARGGRA